jgi:polar amino acid transport system permease protein/arginine transport system permease protein/octopine/nopaline transport system permease protein
MQGLQAFWPQLLDGTLISLRVSVSSLAFGLVFGIILAGAVLYGPSPVRALIRGYVAIIRGLPDLLIIFLAYFGGTILLSRIVGSYVEVDALAAGVFALTVVSSAYFCEIFRGALQSVPPGQREAGSVLGLTARQTFVFILMPQMFARALPGVGNQWLILLKESALVSVVGLEELMRVANIGAAATDNALGFYLSAAMIYITITAVSTLLIKAADAWVSRGQVGARP